MLAAQNWCNTSSLTLSVSRQNEGPFPTLHYLKPATEKETRTNKMAPAADPASPPPLPKTNSDLQVNFLNPLSG